MDAPLSRNRADSACRQLATALQQRYSIQREMATHVRKAQKVPIRGMYDRPIGDRERRNLRIGEQIAGCTSRCAKQLHDSRNVVGR